MKPVHAILAILLIFSGCAGTQQSARVPIWETTDISRAHEVIGPVSVSEQISESTEDMIQGLAGFISSDGRVSSQIPADMRAALDAKKEKYKDMIFDKLGEKAKSYDANAVIGAVYLYVPPYASFSSKATVTAKGTMVKYK